jgi:hypothetical protein
MNYFRQATEQSGESCTEEITKVPDIQIPCEATNAKKKKKIKNKK